MEFADIRLLLIAFSAIAFGTYLKLTTHQKFQSSRKLWKFLVLAGVATLVLKAVAIIIR